MIGMRRVGALKLVVVLGELILAGHVRRRMGRNRERMGCGGGAESLLGRGEGLCRSLRLALLVVASSSRSSSGIRVRTAGPLSAVIHGDSALLRNDHPGFLLRLARGGGERVVQRDERGHHRRVPLHLLGVDSSGVLADVVEPRERSAAVALERTLPSVFPSERARMRVSRRRNGKKRENRLPNMASEVLATAEDGLARRVAHAHEHGESEAWEAERKNGAGGVELGGFVEILRQQRGREAWEMDEGVGRTQASRTNESKFEIRRNKNENLGTRTHAARARPGFFWRRELLLSSRCRREFALWTLTSPSAQYAAKSGRVEFRLSEKLLEIATHFWTKESERKRLSVNNRSVRGSRAFYCHYAGELELKGGEI